MEIRGRRECKECGTAWSYYDTGSVACPQCGSVRSVGIDDERTLHTDAPVSVDLTSVRGTVESAPFEDVADAAVEAGREYVRRRGFVDAGDLCVLDDTYLAVRELVGVGSELGRRLERTDEEEWYFFELLRGADDGRRPATGDVPASIRDARGLAYASAVRAYRRDAVRWLDAAEDPPGPGFARDVLSQLDDHVTRIRALQGDVAPEDAERLVEAARDAGAYLRSEDPDGLASARDRLDRLSDL